MTIELTDAQVTSLIKLVDAETAANKGNGDDAYNTYWDNVRKKLRTGDADQLVSLREEQKARLTNALMEIVPMIVEWVERPRGVVFIQPIMLVELGIGLRLTVAFEPVVGGVRA